MQLSPPPSLAPLPLRDHAVLWLQRHAAACQLAVAYTLGVPVFPRSLTPRVIPATSSRIPSTKAEGDALPLDPLLSRRGLEGRGWLPSCQLAYRREEDECACVLAPEDVGAAAFQASEVPASAQEDGALCGSSSGASQAVPRWRPRSVLHIVVFASRARAWAAPFHAETRTSLCLHVDRGGQAEALGLWPSTCNFFKFSGNGRVGAAFIAAAPRGLSPRSSYPQPSLTHPLETKAHGKWMHVETTKPHREAQVSPQLRPPGAQEKGWC